MRKTMIGNMNPDEIEANDMVDTRPDVEPVTVRDFARFHKESCPNGTVEEATTVFMNEREAFNPVRIAERIVERVKDADTELNGDMVWFYAKDEATDIVIDTFNTTLPSDMAQEVLEQVTHLIQREVFRKNAVV